MRAAKVGSVRWHVETVLIAIVMIAVATGLGFLAFEFFELIGVVDERP